MPVLLKEKEQKSPDDFWKEYEESTGEKVLERSLGKYISGWDEFDEKKLAGIWGLIITTSGGFRFHHFPQHSWIDAFTRSASRELPKEKTIFIPKETITSFQLTKEKNWLKKLFSSCPPGFIVTYTDENSDERKLVFQVEYNIDKK